MTLYSMETKRTFLLPFSKKEATLFHTINTDPYIKRFLWDNEVIPLTLTQEIMHQLDYGFSLKNLNFS